MLAVLDPELRGVLFRGHSEVFTRTRAKSLFVLKMLGGHFFLFLIHAPWKH